ncbi:MAG: hypothetical protein HKP48_07355 [Winogradskyella sp.]|uniref:hypothetical protein n=1 Tax=Winogradskyella sp. TaxID=1883156 RepID=UPI0017B41D72|nr:hypothetical protein [Winogradskyella sp.]MBT8244586.1 hypothetical protein [Winogradskyella sp.]NNK23098.1 hypothetical protein [Winogradskyella sp.]
MKKNKLNSIKSTGFKTPKDYFESFDDKLIQSVVDNTLIKDIDTSGFKTPEGYFYTLEDNILKHLKLQNETPVISIFRRKSFYYVSGIAASLLFLFAIFISQPKTEELSADLVQNYLIETELNSYELAKLLVDANILEENFTIIETNYKEENLEDYLLENSDIESILE